jgi:hypothetical protein
MPYFLLINLLSLVAFAAGIWLVVVAFKRSVGWGLAVLFLSPIAAIIFAIKYWEESKKPFLIYTGSFVAAIVLMVMMIGSLGGYEMMQMATSGEDISDEEAAEFMNRTMDKWEDSGLMSAEDKRKLREMRQQLDQDLASGSTGTATTAPGGTDRPVARRTPGSRPGTGLPRPTWKPASSGALAIPPQLASSVPRGYKSIPVHQADDHIGKVIRLTERSGLQHKGTLAKTDAQTLLLEKYLTAGTVGLEFRKSEIEALHVSTR